jgi:hypothetical protein
LSGVERGVAKRKVRVQRKVKAALANRLETVNS